MATTSDPFELEVDAQLVHLLVERFAEDEGYDLREDRLALLRLLQAAREARARLAVTESADVSIPFVCNDDKGRPLSLRDTITRRDLRRAQARDDFWDTLDRLQDVLMEGGARPGVVRPQTLTDDDLGDYSTNLPVVQQRRWVNWKWISRGIGAFIILLVVAIGWLALTAPLSKSLQPPTPPSITLLAADGSPIARRGAIIGKPVDAATLPKHIPEAFLAIEDRRFYRHLGIDPWGIGRAAYTNFSAGGVREGASTITQQLAKNAFLDSDRTAARKVREVMIAFWLEAWLTKDEILSRYLSNVYFGDNVYGLQAAAQHYFGRDADKLSIAQAAMLAGLVKAPSRLAPTTNLKGARERAKLVVGAMVEAGFLTKAEAADVGRATPRKDIKQTLPSGTYFADWVLPEAREAVGEVAKEATVRTTLDTRIQKAAETAVRRAGLTKAQVGIVVMRPNGQVVAMVGGKDYRASPFNRAVQARRQPGSAFKLFVYLAALRAGMDPDDMIEDTPVRITNWEPKNSDGRYLGKITLRQAFARSSNVAAARLIHQVGVKAVIRAARDLGVTAPLPEESTIALGTATMSLLELTSAYASVAAGQYPVKANGLADVREGSWLDSIAGGPRAYGGDVRDDLLDLLGAAVEYGTAREAALEVKAFGKTGTTQDNRDALFIGFANDLITGVWVGNDDNTPNPGLSGGGLPARIWRDVMMSALRVGGPPRPEPTAIPVEEDPIDLNIIDDAIDGAFGAIQEGQIEGPGFNLRVGRDGSIDVQRDEDEGDLPPPSRRDSRDSRDRDRPREPDFSFEF